MRKPVDPLSGDARPGSITRRSPTLATNDPQAEEGTNKLRRRLVVKLPAIPVHRRACQFDASIARHQHAPVSAMLKRLKAKYPQVEIMHTYDVPCTATVCTLNFDGLPIYRFDDYHHLSAAGSSLLFPKYMVRHSGELDAILKGREVE